MQCPECGNTNEVKKVIACALPMKMCTCCNCIWGEPWVSIYLYLCAPIEGIFNDEFYFLEYQGPYLMALWHWLWND